MVQLKGSLLTLPQRAKLLRSISAKVLRDEGSKVIVFARGRWPVDTGRSRAALQLEQPSPLQIRLTCKVSALGAGGRPIPNSNYSEYIVSGGVHPWTAYIVVPGRALGRSVPAEIGKRLMAALKAR